LKYKLVSIIIAFKNIFTFLRYSLSMLNTSTTIPTSFTLEELTNPQFEYSINELINWFSTKNKIIDEINQQVISVFLNNGEDTNENIFIFKNSIIDLYQNPIILLNEMVWNQQIVIKLEKKLYNHLTNLSPFQLRRLWIYLEYFIPDDIHLNSYTLKIKNTNYIQIEVKKTGEETVKSDYLWLKAELDSIKLYLKDLQEIEKTFHKLTNFFENEIHFHPEKWALLKSKWTIKKLYDFLQYISSDPQISFEDKKKLTRTEHILENYLNWKKLPGSPLDKEFSNIIF